MSKSIDVPPNKALYLTPENVAVFMQLSLSLPRGREQCYFRQAQANLYIGSNRFREMVRSQVSGRQ
jgi:hypothetical protein